MAERHWTQAQQEVIDSRNENLLVSAAAGSGKTAVLVEHIIQRILDRSHPVDIDEIVVVTFTKAAAAEMRERILQAIERQLEQAPGDAHLLRQSALVHNAFITTIDSFCGYVVRNHFHEIDLEPDYRIGEEGELKLMRAAVMEQFMEQQYQKAEESFLTFVESYSRGSTDSAVTEMIFSLFEKAQSYPWPKEWLHEAISAYEADTLEELIKSSWFATWLKSLRRQIQDMREETEELLQHCQKPQGPSCYARGLTQDVQLYEDILSFDDAKRFYQALCEARYGLIGRKPSGFTGDEVLLKQVKENRDRLKKQMEELQKSCSPSLEEVLWQLQRLRPVVKELVRLTEGFMDAFDAYKRKRNVVDFNDVEHFALRILQDETTHSLRPAALEFQQQFQEIIIDEYQDSNYIQEAILTSISRESIGEHNMFMVGDVKQSIYSFRQACPEIFMEKYKAFQERPQGCSVIELHKNFRSRPQVLELTNDICYSLMKEDLGHITYSKETALYAGASYPGEQEAMYGAEILVGDFDKELLQKKEDKIALEAKLIAERIRRMKEEKMMVTDGETGRLRPMSYRDVVILMRSPGKLAEPLVKVLLENDIPAFAESRTGYFNTVEVETVLHLLRVLDNPKQEISMAAVLHSPIFGLTNDDLAAIRCGHTEKLEECQAFLNRMRRQIPHMPIHAFLQMLLEETGYLHYVSAMPGGQGRRMNLEKLIDQAVAYEKTSFRGLFHFVHYMEQCQKYEVDMGEAKKISEHDDAVAVLSIHKSKGLEYPICFLAGMGRQFNQRDAKNVLVMHADWGIGLTLMDQKRQTREEPLLKKVVSAHVRWDLLGEEIRILYVALTRAKEKLILTGVLPRAKETLDKWEQHKTPMRFHEREQAKTYLEWVIGATSSLREKYPVEVISPQQLLWEEVQRQGERKERKSRMESLLGTVEKSSLQKLEERLSYVYSFFGKEHQKMKYSVSEIKHARMKEAFLEEESARVSFLDDEQSCHVPKFLEEKTEDEKSHGALHGTAMHRFLECYDFTKDATAEEIREQYQRMLAFGRLKKEEAARLSMDKLTVFLQSNLARRMCSAAKAGQLYRERPFVMEAVLEEAGKEAVLVQGIIDAFFVEDGHIVLLDYKTDRVKTKEELKNRYRVQLQLYGNAVSRSLGMPVKEMFLYSFCLQEAIAL